MIRSLLVFLPLAGLFSASLNAQASAVEPVLEPGAERGRAKVMDALPAGAIPAGGLLELLDAPLIDEPAPGEVWAMGRTYKASFNETGFSFVPFLGSEAPQNYPVRFDLEGLRVDGQAAALSERHNVRSQDGRVELERGAITEVYHLGLEHVEQTFVFHERPAAGELVLELGVTTELAMREDGDGWAFENALGGVRYGAAKAVDGAGRVQFLEQRHGPRGIEIVVPADFAASAELPLIVDPVISTFGVISDAANQVKVDVAYDPQTDQYLMVYETAFSVLDHDVQSIFYNNSIGQLVGLSGIDLTSARWSDPQVANNYSEQAFLVVATEGSTIGSRRVLGRVREAVSGSTAPVLTIGGGFSDDSFADVGGFGNDTLTSFDFLVVFQRRNFSLTESRIVAQGVSGGSSLIGGTVDIANISGQTDQKPRISQSSGTIDQVSADHQYMVVWEREESPTNRDIWARVVDFDGDIAGHPRYRAYSFSDALDPVVSMQRVDLGYSSEPFWMIAFERLLGADYDIFAVVAQDGDAFNARNVSNMQDVDQQLEQADPRISLEDNDFLLAYRSENPSGGFDAYFTSLNVVSDGSELRSGVGVRRDSLRDLDGSVQDLAIASDFFDQNGPGGSVALAPWVAQGNVGTDGDVGAAFVVDSVVATTGSQYCEANANSTGRTAWIRSFGSNQSPALSFSLTCQDLPLNQFGLFATAMGNAVTSNPGGSAGNLCLSGAIGRYTDQVASTGSTGTLSAFINPQELEQPNGTVSAMVGETWYFQCWSRDFENGAPTSNFSNGIALTFQ